MYSLLHGDEHINFFCDNLKIIPVQRESENKSKKKMHSLVELFKTILCQVATKKEFFSVDHLALFSETYLNKSKKYLY